MTVLWTQAIIDIPAAQFDVGSQFWQTTSGTTFGEIHPDHDEYVHLKPVAGDMHLELQRIDSNSPGAHLDLLVADIDQETSRAIELGATLVAKPGHAVLTTPGGVAFCLVPFGGESERAPLIEDPVPHALNQISLDVAADHFERDIAFWAAFTGWEPNPRQREEFCSFDQPSSLPIRLLIQRLPEGQAPHAHLDFACGEGVSAVLEKHVALGAAVTESHDRWTVMSDPTGAPYCLTRRDP